MFLGTTFFCGKNTLLPPAINITDFNSLSVSNGTYDHLYLSSDPDDTVNSLDDGWKYETKLNAGFDHDLEGGNVGFSVKNTDTVIIKSREKGMFDWKTIYTIPVKDNSDFNFILQYPYSRNNSVNEYMLLSSINGIENSYVVTECKTDFEGFFIVDKENIYGTIYNVDLTDTTQNINSSIIELLNTSYPTVFTNSDCNYVTGTTSGCFMKMNDNEQIDALGGVKYRSKVIHWLCNNRPKILKLQDGRIYMIQVTGNPTDTNEGHEDLRKITFEWTEIGDVENEQDLFTNGFSDVDIKYW